MEDKAEPVPDFSKDEAESPDPADTPVEAASRQPIPPASAPQPPPPDWDSGGYKLKVDVRMVMVDAIVRDRGGRPLETLKQQDFRIFEDGTEQEIQSFSRDELPLAVALVIDRSGSVSPHMNAIRQAAYKALSQLKRGDQVALFTFAGDVQRLEDLTTDRQRIADRISEIRAGGGTNIVDGLFDAVNYLSPGRARPAPRGDPDLGQPGHHPASHEPGPADSVRHGNGNRHLQRENCRRSRAGHDAGPHLVGRVRFREQGHGGDGRRDH